MGTPSQDLLRMGFGFAVAQALHVAAEAIRPVIEVSRICAIDFCRSSPSVLAQDQAH